jgi:hypothetical protein
MGTQYRGQRLSRTVSRRAAPIPGEHDEVYSGHPARIHSSNSLTNFNPMTPLQAMHLQRTIGNAALNQILNSPSSAPRLQRSTQKIASGNRHVRISVYTSPSAIQRENFTHRWRRIIGRWLNGKTLPTNTYRWDTRAPDVIAQSGFQPWNPAGNIQLDEHVNNAFASGAKQGQAAKMESQWVSTGAYGMLKKLDPTFAQQVLNTNLYKIDTQVAKTTGSFSDANDHFDRLGKKRPYASQREWIKLGGIPGQAVVAWMTGKTFLDQYDFTTGAPDEGALTGWQQMPDPTATT